MSQERTSPIDLETVLETLRYIHGDLEGRSRLGRTRTALGIAIVELETLTREQRALPGSRPLSERYTGSRFVRRRSA
jgi:hypothetical protein